MQRRLDVDARPRSATSLPAGLLDRGAELGVLDRQRLALDQDVLVVGPQPGAVERLLRACRPRRRTGRRRGSCFWPTALPMANGDDHEARASPRSRSCGGSRSSARRAAARLRELFKLSPIEVLRRADGRAPRQRGQPIRGKGFPDRGHSQAPVCRRETERAGFEPAREREPPTRLAGECLQPLGHLSRQTSRLYAPIRRRPSSGVVVACWWRPSSCCPAFSRAGSRIG